MKKWRLLLLPLVLVVMVIPAYSEEDEDESQLYSTGLIKKGGMTGNIDKLLNVNIFVAGRMSQIPNKKITSVLEGDDVDSFSVPGARLYLTGQVYTDVFYKVAYEFSNENDLDPNDRNGRLTDAMLTWKLPVETDLIDRLDVNVGLGPIFLSPAGEEDIFFLDTIEHPLIVRNFLPPGTARDKGLFFKGSFLGQETLQVWAGMYNGTHRRIGVSDPMGLAPAPMLTSEAVDAWGTNAGEDVDQFAYMGRAQLNILNEENMFFMVSGGVSRTPFLRPDPATHAEILDDTLFDLATEVRFNKRQTWLKGEIIRTNTEKTDDLLGFHVTGGHRLGFITESLEVVLRYEQQDLDDHVSSVDDLWAVTVGLNYFFNPEYEHDAKLQLNYIKRESAQTQFANGIRGDNAVLLQFVLGF